MGKIQNIYTMCHPGCKARYLEHTYLVMSTENVKTLGYLGCASSPTLWAFKQKQGEQDNPPRFC
jgi:hypothetical protein